MQQVISKEEVDALMKVPGETRGVAFKNHRDFILKKEGKDGLKKFEDAMIEIGHPLDYKKIQLTSFYPVGLEAIELLVIKKIFNFDDKKIEEIGAFEASASLLMKIFFHYFVSPKTLAEKAPAMWREIYTIGDFGVKEWSEDKRYAIVFVDKFDIHPILCSKVMGYTGNMIKMMVKHEVNREETKCSFKGDSHHEYKITW
jgi:hypothetical protein